MADRPYVRRFVVEQELPPANGWDVRDLETGKVVFAATYWVRAFNEATRRNREDVKRSND